MGILHDDLVADFRLDGGFTLTLIAGRGVQVQGNEPATDEAEQAVEGVARISLPPMMRVSTVRVVVPTRNVQVLALELDAKGGAAVRSLPTSTLSRSS